MNANKIEDVRRRIGFDGCFAVDKIGRSGGVAFFWRNSMKCDIVSYSMHHIDFCIDDDRNGRWRITGFYGYPERTRRRESWALIRRLVRTFNLSWCVIGEFNDLLSPDDKQGWVDHPSYLFQGFRETVQAAWLIDINLEGYPFTWSARKGTNRDVEERLDRAMANQKWFSLFPQATLLNLVAPISDHTPIFLQAELILHCPRRRRFGFENSWLAEHDFMDIVRKGWLNGVEGDVLSRLNGCMESLQSWSKSLRMKFKKDIDACCMTLEALQNRVDEERARNFNLARD